MILCLDVGNSQIFGGLFSDDGTLLFRFRHETNRTATSDQLGIFLRQAVREFGADPKNIKRIGISSVVPTLDYSMGSACIKYFNTEAFWVTPSTHAGIQLVVENPLEVGADMIANAVAATHHFPGKNLIVIDFGTATTFSAVSGNKLFLGAVIQAGMRTSMKALSLNTDQLPSVKIVKPQKNLGKDTTSAIQSGLYYGQIGAAKEILNGIITEVFAEKEFITLGTGGFSHLFKNKGIFDVHQPDLVLNGLWLLTSQMQTGS